MSKNDIKEKFIIYVSIIHFYQSMQEYNLHQEAIKKFAQGSKQLLTLEKLKRLVLTTGEVADPGSGIEKKKSGLDFVE